MCHHCPALYSWPTSHLSFTKHDLRDHHVIKMDEHDTGSRHVWCLESKAADFPVPMLVRGRVLFPTHTPCLINRVLTGTPGAPNLGALRTPLPPASGCCFSSLSDPDLFCPATLCVNNASEKEVVRVRYRKCRVSRRGMRWVTLHVEISHKFPHSFTLRGTFTQVQGYENKLIRLCVSIFILSWYRVIELM